MPSVFHSDAEPPRIGAPAQPPLPAAPRPADAPSVNLPLAATPMTPGHPPRPPLAALPKYPSMETSQCANKHALEPPVAQAPPSMFGQRHFHILLNLQIKSLWQHLHQLRCRSRADRVQRVLQQSLCPPLQKSCPCSRRLLRMTGDLA